MTNIQYYSGAIDAGGCISGAWELYKQKFGLYFGTGLLTMVLIGCIPVLNWFLIGPILGGFYLLILRDMRGEPVEFGTMFKGFERFLPLMVLGLIQALPGIIWTIFQWTVDIGRIFLERRGGDINFYQSSSPDFPTIAAGLSAFLIIAVIVFLIISVAWAITFQFAIPLAAEHDIGVVDAIKMSAGAGWSNPGGIILLFILQILVALLGILMLCIGIFFVIPIIYGATAFAYRQVFPLLDDRNFINVPPPPTIYGGGYGTQQ